MRLIHESHEAQAERMSRWEEDLRLARRSIKEPAAREDIFKQHVDAVYRLAYRLLGNPADAEDVVQETFIEVFASLQNFRGEASLRSWLHRITVRTAGHFRRKNRGRGITLELVQEAIDEGGPDPCCRADAQEALQRLHRYLDRLAESRRNVFILHEVEGYSLPEAAALLNISLTAAKKRVWRARRDLERLAGEDPLLAGFFKDRMDEEDHG